MEIKITNTKPIETYLYIEVGSGSLNNGQPKIVYQKLPIFFGEFEHETTEIDFLIICSDLQGVVEKNDEYKLLGEELPEYLKLLIDVELKDSEQSKIGVLFCGDLYTNLNKRGSSGNVQKVWLALKSSLIG